MRLKGKVSIVSGAASGIGEAVAKTFAREGSSVVVADLNAADGHRVVREIREAGGTAEFIRTNIGRTTDADAMIDFAVEKFGRLDVLHNNAIGAVFGRIGEVTPEAWRKAIDLRTDLLLVLLEEGARRDGCAKSRRDYQHRFRLRIGRRLRIGALQCRQNRSDRADPFGGDRICAQGNSLQLRLPRPDRDAAAAQGQGSPPRSFRVDWRRRADGPFWRAAGDRQRGFVPRLRRGFLYHRRCAGRRRRLDGAYGAAVDDGDGAEMVAGSSLDSRPHSIRGVF